MVGNENVRFALVVTDKSLANSFLSDSEGVMSTYLKALGNGSSGDEQLKAIIATIGDGNKSGISLYQTLEGDKNIWTKKETAPK